MPTIVYHALADHLSSDAASTWPAVTLIYGDELLCQQAYALVLDYLMPQKDRALGVEVFDGSEDTISGVLTSMNTFALLSSAKVVALHNARLFYSTKAQQGLREKMQQTAQAGDMKKASRPFLNLMALLGLALEDLDNPTLRKKVADDVDDDRAPWFSQLMGYCRENSLRVPDKRDDADLLKSAMGKGFPDGHRLVITTDLVDRRKILFKAIEEAGQVVNCSVPKGNTRSDRMAQEAVMKETLDGILGQAGKTISLDARKRMMRWTGFDLRTLTGNLEKLISYSGNRKKISDTDVTAVLRRSRTDPIFEFTNATADRNLPNMLLFMKSLLDDGMHPLQLLAALANQIRRLLLAKDFIVRDQGRSWSSRMTFPQFKAVSLKAVQADDGSFLALLDEWETMLNPPSDSKKRKKTVSTDLVLATHSRSPFPVYQTLKKADNFSLDELKSAVMALSETDVRMKSTGQDPRRLLEVFLFALCRKSMAKRG